MRLSLILLLAALLLPSCLQRKTSSETKQSTRELPPGITSPKASTNAKNTKVWIDVRSQEEFASGHLDGAINIPHTEISESLPSAVPNRDTPINFYCRSGRRSGLALETAKAMGYTNLHNKGSYQELSQSNDKP